MNLVFWALAAVVGCFGLGALRGAPFLPVRRPDIEAILDLAAVTTGQTVVDLGCGDGRLLVAVAKRGGFGVGYEINPLLYLWSRLRTWRYRQHIRLHFGDYWHRPLPATTDVVYVFLIGRYTQRLDAKLRAELQRPTLVVSYVFQLPRRSVRRNRNSFVYRYP